MTESRSETATCAVHAGQPAFVTCRACGAPACEYCLGEGATGDLCDVCARKDSGGGVIAWERRDLPVARRFLRTLAEVLGRSGTTFAELRPGSVGAALGYAALVWALTSLFALFLVAPCAVMTALGWQTPLTAAGTAIVPIMVGLLCGGPVLAAVEGVIAALVIGVMFHLAARALGGRGDLASGVRAAAYGQTIVILWAPLTLTLLVPVLGAVALALGVLAQLAWGAHVLSTVAATGHGLRGGRALAAGAAPSMLALVLIVGSIVLSLAVDLGPSRAPDVYETPDARVSPVDY